MITYDVDSEGRLHFVSSLIGKIYRAVRKGGAQINGAPVLPFVKLYSDEHCEIFTNGAWFEVTYENALETAQKLGLV